MAFVYYSYEEWGRGYIGFCSTGREDYYGSFSDQTFKPTERTILFEGTIEECLEVEVKLHAFFDVARNPHFANCARQTSTGFTTTGRPLSAKHREAIRRAHAGKHVSPETRALISANNGSRQPAVAEAKRQKMLEQDVSHWNKAGCAAAAATPKTQAQLDQVRALGKRPKSAETRERMRQAALRRKRK